MIEIYLKYDNMHIFGMINAFNCINNHVISCINSMLSIIMLRLHVISRGREREQSKEEKEKERGGEKKEREREFPSQPSLRWKLLSREREGMVHLFLRCVLLMRERERESTRQEKDRSRSRDREREREINFHNFNF